MNTIVVLPIFKNDLTETESISLEQLRLFIHPKQVCVIRPKNVKKNKYFKNEITFENKNFTSRNSYSKLLLSSKFYERFSDYDYMLIYQLDCLIFSNDLKKWTDLNYDYIGAPWFKSSTEPKKGLSHVGNGGLSLRKISTFIKVLNSTHIPNYQYVFSNQIPDVEWFNLKKKYRIIKECRYGVHWYSENYSLNEDLFWSNRAKLFYPSFNIACNDIGLKFSFEKHPRLSYKINGKKLPFGVHGWEKWDKSFWSNYLTNYES